MLRFAFCVRSAKGLYLEIVTIVWQCSAFVGETSFFDIGWEKATSAGFVAKSLGKFPRKVL